MDEQTKAQIKQALAQILANPAFQATENRSRFLEYIVTETLEKRDDKLKGYTIGVEVYGRDPSFDPQSDPIVRLEARRLRRDLEHYYLTAGKDNAIWFAIPKGRYVPTFEFRNIERQPEPNPIGIGTGDHDPLSSTTQPDQREPGSHNGTRRIPPPQTNAQAVKWKLSLVLVAAMILFSLVWIGWPNGVSQQSEPLAAASSISGPTVFVAPFEAVSDGTDEASLGKGLSIEIVNMLSQFVELHVYPVGPTFLTSGLENYTERRKGTELHFVLSGNVQIIDDELRITARLQKASDSLQVWSERYDSAFLPEQIFVVQESIASNVTRKLAEPFGLLRKFSRREIKSLYNPSLATYRCVLAGYEYRQKFSVELHEVARACLEKATQDDPDYARAWALLAYIYVDEYRFFYNTRPGAHARAVEAARRAVALNSDDVLSYQALSVALFGNGDIDAALDAGRKAVALNPHNNEALIQLGYRTGAAGNWQQGIVLAQKAIAESPIPPAWYHWVPALYHYTQGEYETARIGAEKAGLSNLVLFEATRAMIYGQLGMRDKAAASLEICRQLDVKFDIRARDWFAAHQFSDDVLDHFMEGLYKAGLQRV